jgi:hypothetical protein
MVCITICGMVTKLLCRSVANSASVWVRAWIEPRVLANWTAGAK